MDLPDRKVVHKYCVEEYEHFGTVDISLEDEVLVFKGSL